MNSYNMMVSEKLIKYGASSLTNPELLQTLVWSGVKDCDFKSISKNLNTVIEKFGIDNITVDDLLGIKGIGIKKATSIIACIEFFRRKFTHQIQPLIDSPEKAAELLHDIADKKQEYGIVLTLNGARRLINKHVVFKGTVCSSIVHPREVYSLAIEDRAASVIFAHNHPSGCLDISDHDREVTNRLRQAGDIIGIRFDDHIIVAKCFGQYIFVSAY